MKTKKTNLKKIAIIGSDPGSIMNFRKELILEIKKSGFQPYIIVPKINSSQKLQSFCKKYQVHLSEIFIDRYSLNIFKELSSIFSILKAIFKIKPNCVITYTMKANLYGTLASMILRVPIKICLITGLGFFFRSKTSTARDLFISQLFRLILRRADSIFFQNSDDMNEFKKRDFFSENQNILMIPGSGVNLNYYYFSKQPNNDNLIFLTISRLLVDKGIIDLFHLARNIYHKHVNINFLIVGGEEDGQNSISESHLRLIRAQKNIQLVGKVEDVRPYIEKSNVLIHPSHHEGMPRSVLEAMSMGRPIITTNAPGCRESIVHNLNGFIVEKGNWKSLNYAVEKFIINPRIIYDMSLQSRALAEKKFDVDIVNKKILDEIRRLLACQEESSLT